MTRTRMRAVTPGFVSPVGKAGRSLMSFMMLHQSIGKRPSERANAGGFLGRPPASHVGPWELRLLEGNGDEALVTFALDQEKDGLALGLAGVLDALGDVARASDSFLTNLEHDVPRCQ